MASYKDSIKLCFRVEKLIKPPLAIEFEEVVAATDMAHSNEDLRDAAAAARPLYHGRALLRLKGNVDLLVGDALAPQQVFGPGAIGAKPGGEDGDGRAIIVSGSAIVAHELLHSPHIRAGDGYWRGLRKAAARHSRRHTERIGNEGGGKDIDI